MRGLILASTLAFGGCHLTKTSSDPKGGGVLEQPLTDRPVLTVTNAPNPDGSALYLRSDQEAEIWLRSGAKDQRLTLDVPVGFRLELQTDGLTSLATRVEGPSEWAFAWAHRHPAKYHRLRLCESACQLVYVWEGHPRAALTVHSLMRMSYKGLTLYWHGIPDGLEKGAKIWVYGYRDSPIAAPLRREIQKWVPDHRDYFELYLVLDRDYRGKLAKEPGFSELALAQIELFQRIFEGKDRTPPLHFRVENYGNRIGPEPIDLRRVVLPL